MTDNDSRRIDETKKLFISLLKALKGTIKR